MEVALKLIAERGIHSTRVEDITEKADLGKGAFYNYFESKDRLVAELVAEGIEVLHRDYLHEPEPTSSRVQRIESVITAHDRFFRDHPAYLTLFHQARGLATLHARDHFALTPVFLAYLQRTGAAIVSAEESPLDETARIDIAAVILGAISGYRSFTVAAGIAHRPDVVAAALSAGISALIDARLHA